MKYHDTYFIHVIGHRIYVDILTKGKIVVNLACQYRIKYWLVYSLSKRGGNGVKRWMGGKVILASCGYPFIRVHEI